MSDDVLRLVLSFLSTEEKIKIREVSKGYKNLVSQRCLKEYRLKWLLKRFVQREDKLELHLNINARHIYSKRVENRLHPYFSRQCQDKCIVDRCHNERLGYIYIKDRKVDHLCPNGGDVWTCNKRKISYCVQCFELWMIRCSMADLNLRFKPGL